MESLRFFIFSENVLKQTEQEVVYDQASFNKNVLSPYYKSHKILNEDLVIVEKYKDFVSLDKPVQIASAILELAKYTMYNYYYNVLLPAYNNRVELIYINERDELFQCHCKNHLFCYTFKSWTSMFRITSRHLSTGFAHLRKN